MSLNGSLSGAEAHVIADLVRRRSVSPVEVLDATIAAFERIDPILNALCTDSFDLARQAARDLERRILRGEAMGAMAGVPVAIKDLIFTKGIRTTFGSRLYADFIPEDDDVAVERLRAVDAIIIGKTNVCEFGFGSSGNNALFATTRNPWNPDLTPGGSSSGSAAVVGAGLCPVALGSDGGGSIRLPAAFCGVVGMKPSMGRIPLWPGCRDERYPGASGWESIEHYGPLSRSVLDAAHFMQAVAGPDERDRLSLPGSMDWVEAARTDLPSGLRIAYCPQWAGVPVDPHVRDVVAAAVRAFADDLGCDVELAPAPLGDLTEATLAIVALETDLAGLKALARGRERELSATVRNLLGKSWKAEQFTDAITLRKAAVNAMARFMQRYDLILTPTVPTTAFPAEASGPGRIAGVPVPDDVWSPYLNPSNLTGQPAISVPAGWTPEGMPVGLQIVGRRFADGMVLSAAAAFERVRPWSHRHPAHSVWNATQSSQPAERVGQARRTM